MAKQERDPDNVDSSSCPIQAVVALLASPGEDGRDRGRFTTDLQEKACGLGRFPFDGAAFLRSFRLISRSPFSPVVAIEAFVEVLSLILHALGSAF